MYQKVYNINKSLKEFCNTVHRLIKNTLSMKYKEVLMKWITKYANILMAKH